MKILKKGGGVVEKRGEKETKSMPHAPVDTAARLQCPVTHFSKFYQFFVLIMLFNKERFVILRLN
jgi:hypothetical protein